MNKIEELKKALSELPRRADGKLRSVPEQMRTEIAALVKRDGRPTSIVARELGLSGSIVGVWVREQTKSKSKLRPIRIVNEVGSGTSVAVIEGPHGLRVRGLSIVELAELMTALEAR